MNLIFSLLTNAADFSLKLGEILTVVISVIVLYFIIRLVLYLLSRLFDIITQSRAISGLDRILGLVLGAAKGVVCLFLVFGIIYIIAILIPAAGTEIQTYLSENTVSYGFFNWVTDVIENTIIPFFVG